MLSWFRASQGLKTRWRLEKWVLNWQFSAPGVSCLSSWRVTYGLIYVSLMMHERNWPKTEHCPIMCAVFLLSPGAYLYSWLTEGRLESILFTGRVEKWVTRDIILSSRALWQSVLLVPQPVAYGLSIPSDNRFNSTSRRRLYDIKDILHLTRLPRVSSSWMKVGILLNNWSERNFHEEMCRSLHHISRLTQHRILQARYHSMHWSIELQLT